ncbi:MAG: hypothetical protein QOH26_1991 [Actinomycetota bacterium]|nr:hypothetical protein [Actinomycetota bacterium]
MLHDEGGHGVIDVFLLGLLFLAPLVWGLGVLADLHRAALATTAAAREAGFDAAAADDPSQADAAVEDAVRRAFVDQSMDATGSRVRWSASPNLERGGRVEVIVAYPVTVLQAPFLGRVSGPSIWVTAKHVAPIDLYGSRE